MDSNLPRLQLELYKEIKKVGFCFLLLKEVVTVSLHGAVDVKSCLLFNKWEREKEMLFGKADLTVLFFFARLLFIISLFMRGDGN